MRVRTADGARALPYSLLRVSCRTSSTERSACWARAPLSPSEWAARIARGPVLRRNEEGSGGKRVRGERKKRERESERERERRKRINGIFGLSVVTQYHTQPRPPRSMAAILGRAECCVSPAPCVIVVRLSRRNYPESRSL